MGSSARCTRMPRCFWQHHCHVLSFWNVAPAATVLAGIPSQWTPLPSSTLIDKLLSAYAQMNVTAVARGWSSHHSTVAEARPEVILGNACGRFHPANAYLGVPLHVREDSGLAMEDHESVHTQLRRSYDAQIITLAAAAVGIPTTKCREFVVVIKRRHQPEETSELARFEPMACLACNRHDDDRRAPAARVSPLLEERQGPTVRRFLLPARGRHTRPVHQLPQRRRPN